MLKIICIQKKKVQGSVLRNEVLFLENSVNDKEIGAKNKVKKIEMPTESFRTLLVAKTARIMGKTIIKYELNLPNILNNGMEIKIEKNKIKFRIET